MSKKKLELCESEWVILQILWEKEPCTAPTMQEELQADKGWAYTTVKTLMDRMVKKGLLKVEKLRNLYLYTAAVSRKQARMMEVSRTVKRAFDGAFTPMMQFLIESETLSDDDFALVEKMIRERKKKQRAAK